MLTEGQVLPECGERRPHMEAQNYLGGTTDRPLNSCADPGKHLPRTAYRLLTQVPVWSPRLPAGPLPIHHSGSPGAQSHHGADPPTWGLAPSIQCLPPPAYKPHRDVQWCTPSSQTRGSRFGFGRWMPMVTMGTSSEGPGAGRCSTSLTCSGQWHPACHSLGKHPHFPTPTTWEQTPKSAPRRDWHRVTQDGSTPLLPAGWITTLTKACFLSFSSHSFNVLKSEV